MFYIEPAVEPGVPALPVDRPVTLTIASVAQSDKPPHKYFQEGLSYAADFYLTARGIDRTMVPLSSPSTPNCPNSEVQPTKPPPAAKDLVTNNFRSFNPKPTATEHATIVAAGSELNESVAKRESIADQVLSRRSPYVEGMAGPVFFAQPTYFSRQMA